MVAQALTCPECGGDIPSDARTLGLCPRCLLSHVADAAGAPGRLAPGRRPFTAPDVDDLADEFPRLRVLEFLGQGGMGAVYRARQADLDRDVALKIIPTAGPTGASRDPAFGERFGREARALASLTHPNVVAAYEFGRSGRYDYLIMELVRGPSLREVLHAGGVPRRVSPRAAIRIVRQLGDALDYAHRRGITHRDVKPENILLESPAGDATEAAGAAGASAAESASSAAAPDASSLEDFLDRGGRVRVVDFGLAKWTAPGSAGFSLTAPDQRVGTGIYMAPEQLEGRREVDARADVYAVGVVLYEMLTGELPVGRFPPPSRTPGVSRRLDRIVWRCLEKDPDRRYPDVACLCRDLAPTRAAVPRIAVAAGAALLFAAAVGAGVVGVVAARRAARRPVASVATPPPPAEPAFGSATPATTRDLTRPAGPPSAPAAGPSAPPPVAPFPAFPPFPAAPDLGPSLSGFRRLPTQEDWYRQLVRQHGAQRVVTVRVDGLSGDVSPFIRRRLGELSGCGNLLSSGSADSLTVHLAPVADVQALADKIDFGTVKAVDPERRVIDVLAEQSKLPPPLPPVVKDVRAPNFYARNLADLGSWDPGRRHDALRRLKDAQPDAATRPAVVKAMMKMSSEEDAGARKDAVDALVAWGRGDAVAPLIDLLKDPDHWVKQKAAEGLGKLGDARAAEPLAEMLATDRHMAAEALKALGPKAEPAVRARLRHADPSVRTESARLLGAIGTADSLPELEAAASSSDFLLPVTARASIQAIRKRTQPTTGEAR